MLYLTVSSEAKAKVRLLPPQIYFQQPKKAQGPSNQQNTKPTKRPGDSNSSPQSIRFSAARRATGRRLSASPLPHQSPPPPSPTATPLPHHPFAARQYHESMKTRPLPWKLTEHRKLAYSRQA